jgi:hypothetical protein
MCENLKALMLFQAKQISDFFKLHKIESLADKQFYSYDLIQNNSENWRKAFCGGICPFRKVCKENRWLQ